MTFHRAAGAVLGAVCLMLIAIVPVLFRRPPSTLSRRSVLLELAATVAESDSMELQWTETRLDSAVTHFHPQLRLEMADTESLAIGAHSLYPYRFLTLRQPERLTIALAPPLPPLPLTSAEAAALGSAVPQPSGECLVYVLRSDHP